MDEIQHVDAWASDPLARCAQVELELRRADDPETVAKLHAELVEKPAEIRAMYEKAPPDRMYRIRSSYPSANLRGTIGYVLSYHDDGNVGFVVLFPPPGRACFPVGTKLEVPIGYVEEVPLPVVERRAKELHDARQRGPQVGIAIMISEGGEVSRFLVEDKRARITAQGCTDEDLVLALEHIHSHLARRHRAAPEKSEVLTPSSALVEEVSKDLTQA